MLTLFSKQSANRYCDGLSRRSFLRIGDRLLVGYNDELYAQFGT